MPSLTSAELRERIELDLPGCLVETPRPAPPATGKPAHEAKPNLLATDDVVIAPSRLIDAALYLRDTLGYAYLSDITAVDYLSDNCFELVYRFYTVAGGDGLALKVRVPRATPEVPALTPHWPGANFHEREAFDLFGITFIGHPYLQRIYMWDEFEGFPMRKDFPKQGDKYIGEEE